MKKIFLAGLLFCSMLSASAQSQGDVRFGVTGGMNVSNITDLDADCRIGFNLGARIEYGITDNLYFGSGLLFSQKGYEKEYSGIEDGTLVNLKLKGNPLYLQIPIQLGYHHNLSNNVGLFAETGPYLAFGIAGKNKAEASIPGVASVSEKEDFFGSDAANVFDMGWGLRAGVNVSKFQIHLGYEYGFTKVADDTSCHNSNFNVGLTYFF